MRLRQYALVLLGLAASAQADHLINIPVGKKVPFGVYRLYGSFEQGGLAYGSLDFGINSYLDGSIRTDNVGRGPRRLTGDLSYNFVAPIVDISPGLSFGLFDLWNQTVDGRRGFIATTFRFGLDSEATTFVAGELTLGMNIARKSTPYVGFMLPLTDQFRLLAEHDGYRVNAGIDLRPVRHLALKVLFIDGVPQTGLQIQSKF